MERRWRKCLNAANDERNALYCLRLSFHSRHTQFPFFLFKTTHGWRGRVRVGCCTRSTLKEGLDELTHSTAASGNGVQMTTTMGFAFLVLLAGRGDCLFLSRIDPISPFHESHPSVASKAMGSTHYLSRGRYSSKPSCSLFFSFFFNLTQTKGIAFALIEK